MYPQLPLPRHVHEDMDHFPDDAQRQELPKGLPIVTPARGRPLPASAWRRGLEFPLVDRPVRNSP